MEREKIRTRRKILDATGRLLALKGFENLGINAIAREAKVSKVLIYRYFGGLSEVLREFAEEGGFWPTNAELLGGEINLRRVTNSEQMSILFLTNYLKEMRRRKLTQEVLRRELAGTNELTEHLSRMREKQRLEILAALPLDSARYGEIDIGAAAALMHAGITYLVLRSKTGEEYMGIDLHSNFGWKRLEKAIETLVKGYFAQHEGEAGKK